MSLNDGQVAFAYKDYRQGQRERVMRLEAVEFMRRFLLHVLPKGFVRIRHYGLLSNRSREQKLLLCRRLLGSVVEPESDTEPTRSTETASSEGPDLCPACQQGQMLTMGKLSPSRAGPEPRMNSPNAA